MHCHGFCTNVHLNSKSYQNHSEILATEGNVTLKKLTGDLVVKIIAGGEILATEGNVTLKKLTGDLVVKIIAGGGGTSGGLCGKGVFVQEFLS